MKLYVVAVALALDHGHTALRVEPLGAVKHVLLERAEAKQKHEAQEELLAHEAKVERGYGYRVRSEEEEHAEAKRRTRRGGETRTLATELLRDKQLEEMESATGSTGQLVAPPGALKGASIYVSDTEPGFIILSEKDGDRVISMDGLESSDEPMKYWYRNGRRPILNAGFNHSNVSCGDDCFVIEPIAIASMTSFYNEAAVKGAEAKNRADNVYVAEATKLTRWINYRDLEGLEGPSNTYDPKFVMEGIFDNPFEMVTTKNGRLFISDTGNNRVLQIKIKDFYDKMVEQQSTCIGGDDQSSSCLWWRQSEWDQDDKGAGDGGYEYKEAEEALLQTRERVSPEELEAQAGGADEDGNPNPASSITGEWEMHIVVGGDGTNPGSGLNQLEKPMGIAVHMMTHHGPKADSPEILDLYVADAHHRVLKFTMTAYDENKMVIDTVLGPQNRSIHHVKWSESGEIVAGSGLNAAGNCCVAGDDRGSLNTPTGLAVKNHWLYIADSGNDRVLMWEMGAKTAIQVIRAIKEPHDLALWKNRITIVDGNGNVRMWNLPCTAPTIENTKKESCAGGMIIPDGGKCEPQCTDSFASPQLETDRLQCEGHALRFKCELAGPPHVRVTDVTFKDVDPEYKELGGVITWQWPDVVEAISELEIYYGKTGDPAKTLIASVATDNLTVNEWSFDELGPEYRTGRGIAFCLSGEIRLILRNKFGLSDRVATIPYVDFVDGGWKQVAEDEEKEDETAENDCDAVEGITATAISKPDCTTKTINETKEGDAPACFKDGEEGMFFFFDKAKFFKRMGFEVKNDQLVRMSLFRHGYKVGTGQIKIWCDEKVAAVGDCRGRIDPEWAAEQYQWKVGDVLTPTSFAVQAANKKGCYDPESACCQDGNECWPVAGRYFFFDKAAAEDAIGMPIETNNTLLVRQLRDTVGVWEGTVMFDCRRPDEDDANDLWGNCFGQICADPVKYDADGRCVTETYVQPDMPLPRWAENDLVQPLGAGLPLTHKNQTHGLHDPAPPDHIDPVTGEKDNATDITANDTTTTPRDDKPSFIERLQFGNLRENMRR